MSCRVADGEVAVAGGVDEEAVAGGLQTDNITLVDSRDVLELGVGAGPVV
jgi:3-keto-L-gulonate-6-phosphate decarboxylase